MDNSITQTAQQRETLGPLTELGMRTLRALCMTAEAASRYVERQLRAEKELDPLELELAGRCASRARHAAQDAMNNAAGSDKRAQRLLDDVSFLLAINREKLRRATRVEVPDNAHLHLLRDALTKYAALAATTR